MSSVRPPLTVTAVDWEHPDAVTLRDEMAAEVGPRYAHLARQLPTNPNAVDPATVHSTFVAYSDGPVGHAALRWNAEDLEVKRMFVRPAHRGSGRCGVVAHRGRGCRPGGRAPSVDPADRSPATGSRTLLRT
ncbi:GNAT family N-acetyltransferase [Nocardia sp. CY41]|uniref:GNAT family N-acetyltransferase n=1 Tax=Nocardia sp. CY41 TaxID=2608686 RepID=UPI001F303E29|nr:GNAT family N-acetyltransferase [Nocardia sp. CY41]